MQKPDSLTSQYRSLVGPCEPGNKIQQIRYLTLQLFVSASQEAVCSIEFSHSVS